MITDPDTLQRRLGLAAQPLPLRALREFPVKVPAAYLARIQRGVPTDPLLRQVWPRAEEDQAAIGYVHDPLEEAAATRVPGILHKYHGRALLLATGACAIHCRYCFRRHFPYPVAERTGWSEALEYLRQTPSIRELILSGGDPLTLSNRRLAELLQAVEEIAHIERLRIHSRVPVVLPSRIDTPLLQLLQGCRMRCVLVVHVNHAQELDESARQTLQALGEHCMLLNQSVLLRGVNDNMQALYELSERLFDCATLPYYLHLPDRVAGTAHFYVDLPTARALLYQLRERLPGYLVPRLVEERPGVPYKVPLL